MKLPYLITNKKIRGDSKIAPSVCRKTSIAIKNGVWGVAPMRVVSRRCRCVVQRLCATDFKRPCLVRAAAPHSAPARMPGVYAQRLCRTQSQPSIHSLSPRGRGLGIGVENKQFLKKTDFFYKLKGRSENRPLTLLVFIQNVNMYRLSL